MNTRPSLVALTLERARLENVEFVRSRDQMIFIFSFPIIFMVLFGAIFGGQELAFGVTFPQYLLAGLIASGILNTGFQSLGIAIAIDRDNGVLKRLRGTPLPPAAYFGGKVLHVLFVSAVQVALLIAMGVAFYGVSLPTGLDPWLTFAWVFLLGVTGSTLLGIAVSSLPSSGRAASAIITPMVLYLQFTSGVFFVFTQLPGFLQTVAEFFPLKWLAQGMRSVFLPEDFAQAEARMSYELTTGALVLAAWVVVGFILALVTFRWQKRGDS